MRNLTLTLLAWFCAALVPLLAVPPAPAQAANCEFVLGFQIVHNLIPNVVGVCAENEHFNPANGDSLQQTMMPNGQLGLLVWRKADNWTAFTDGYHTWINGPYGVQERLNSQCLPWETACVNGQTGSGTTATGTTVAFTAVAGAAPGGTASVTVKTSPFAVCAIDYFGPKGVDRYEFGALHRKQADASGNVGWSWLIAPNTPAGNGTVMVNCEGVVQNTAIPIS